MLKIRTGHKANMHSIILWGIIYFTWIHWQAIPQNLTMIDPGFRVFGDL